MKKFHKPLIFTIIFSIGLGVGQTYFVKNKPEIGMEAEKNTPQAFTSEIYDKIMQNYWDNVSDAQLLDLFKLSFDKNGGSAYSAKFENKEQLIKAVVSTTRGMD